MYQLLLMKINDLNEMYLRYIRRMIVGLTIA